MGLGSVGALRQPEHLTPLPLSSERRGERPTPSPFQGRTHLTPLPLSSERRGERPTPSPFQGEGRGEVRLVGPTKPVPRYGRAEFTIEGVPACRNPFDPQQADVRIEVRTPSNRTLTVPAHYCEPFEIRGRASGADMGDCFFALGRPGWRARYAPTELGPQAVVAVARVGSRELRSRPVTIRCVPSAAQGYLRVSGKDRRFLETDDGKPFFVVGQNVAFVKDTFQTREYLAKLAGNGVNYVRVWTCCEDWGLCLEGRKSGWARTWDWKPPFVTDPKGGQCVRVAAEGATLRPTQRMGLEARQRYVLSATAWAGAAGALSVSIPGVTGLTSENIGPEPRRIQWTFTIGTEPLVLDGIRLTPSSGTVFLRGLSLKAASGDREILWDADPNRLMLGNYSQVDCAMLDRIVEDAEKLGIRLQLCVLTRDLYMDRLKDPASADYAGAISDARNLLRYAIARWGYSTAVAAWEYWNEMDPGKPTGRFFSEVGAYLAQTDPYRRLRTTSSWADSPADWAHPAIDIANMHWYMRPAEGERYRDAVAGVLEKARQLRARASDKPALFAEFGLAQDNWQPSADAKKDLRSVHLKHALWASALSGLSGTAMAWWWEDLHERGAYSLYAPLARFLKGIPWTTARLEATNAQVAPAHLRSVALAGGDRAYIWVYDTRASWHAQAVQGLTPEQVSGATLAVRGLREGRYAPTWFDTQTGRTTEGEPFDLVGATAELGLPPFTGDMAIAIVRRGVTMNTPARAAAPSDDANEAVRIVERATKVSQLTGDVDRQTGQPTLNRTDERFRLQGTDLGVSFEHKGRTYFVFGDTYGPPGGDAVAWTTSRDPEKGLALTFLSESGVYTPLLIPGISQAGFEVPMAGVSIGGRMYVYHTTDHTPRRTMGRSVLAVSENDGKTFRLLYDVSNPNLTVTGWS